MRKQIWALLGGVAVLLLAQAILAQDPPAGEPREGAATREAHRVERPWAVAMVDHLVKELELSGDKETRFRELLKESRQAMRTWLEENGEKFRELMDQLMEAREANDEAKIKELREELKKLNESRRAVRDNLFGQLKGLLTDEQIEKVKDAVIEWRVGLLSMVKDLNLTAEQKAKLRQLIKDWREETVEETAPGQRGRGLRTLIEKVVTDVILTDAQRAALAKMPAEEKFFDKVMKLDLTEAQKAQIEKLREPPQRRFRPREGGPESRPATGHTRAPKGSVGATK